MLIPCRTQRTTLNELAATSHHTPKLEHNEKTIQKTTPMWCPGSSSSSFCRTIRPDERKYFCATAILRGKRRYLAYMRAARGSAIAPLPWASLAACRMRLILSSFDPRDLALMCDVDDPLAALRGTLAERRINSAIMIWVWEAPGFRLVYKKGQLGRKATLVDGTITCEMLGIRVSVKDTIVEDIKADLTKFLAANVIPNTDLRSAVGRLNHAAGLLIIMRPFMEPLWAASCSTKNGGAPFNYSWTRQIIHALRWFKAFFDKEGSHLERFFSMDAFNRRGTVVEIDTDASPWGLGG